MGLACSFQNYRRPQAMAGARNLFFNAKAWGFRARWAQSRQLNSVRRLTDRPASESLSVLGLDSPNPARQSV